MLLRETVEYGSWLKSCMVTVCNDWTAAHEPGVSRLQGGYKLQTDVIQLDVITADMRTHAVAHKGAAFYGLCTCWCDHACDLPSATRVLQKQPYAASPCDMPVEESCLDCHMHCMNRQTAT